MRHLLCSSAAILALAAPAFGAGSEVPDRRGRVQLGQLRGLLRGARPDRPDAHRLRPVARRGPGDWPRPCSPISSEATGATVSYSSSENYEQQIVIDTEAGSAPNIAILPQPGLIQTLVSKGFVTPLGDETGTWLEENYAAGDSWVTLSTFTGPDGTEDVYAFPYKIDVKSLVWYVPENFEDAGYEVPTTMEELKALTEQIVADGETPWCIGLGSGGATGLAGDRLGRGHDAAHAAARGLRPVGDERDALHRPGRGRRDRGVRLVRQERRLRRRRRGRGRLDRLPRQPARASSARRRSATCTTRRRSSRPSSPKGPSSASMPTSSTFRPTRRRTWAARSSAPARSPSSPRTARRRTPSSSSSRPRSRTRSGWRGPAS